jgi:hypothetical protein
MQEDTRDDYGMMIAKKSERLVTALYLVTDLIDGSDPIKNGLRKNCVALLSSMNALAQMDVKDKLTEFKMSLRSVTEIISLLHVASTTGLISDMNGIILTEGFRTLQLVLEKKQPILTRDMLTIDSEEALSSSVTQHSGIVSTSYDVLTPLGMARAQEKNAQGDVGSVLKRQSTIQVSQGNTNPEAKEKVSSTKRQEDGQQKGQVSVPSVRSVLLQHATPVPQALPSSFQNRKQTRREQIVSLFVKGVDVSIKDIAARIKGCSEKTIQRELNALVYDNVIERIGEKRWSRYILR